MTISKNLGLLAPQVSSSGNISYADLTNKPSLSTVATSGSYADLSNKPVVISLKGSTVTYPGDDLAADTTGAQTIIITGTGFESTPTVYVGGTIAPAVTFVSATQITFTTPAKTAGTYDIYIVNPGGATAIMVYGISYSGTPSWTTAAGSLGTLENNWTVQLQATSNSAVTYALTSGSTLPTGVTLSSSGLITGTSISTEQTFNFSVTATDAENQDTPRSFSITITLGEPYFKYTALLLTGDGTNAAQNNTFLDSGPNNITITRYGNPSQGSFSPYGDRWSNYFNGSDSLTTATNSAFTLGTGNFTIEMWYNPSVSYASGNGYLFDMGANGTRIQLYQNTVYFLPVSGTDIQGPVGVGMAIGQWNHVAVVRNGSTITLYINGTSAGSTTNSNNQTDTQVRIGGYGGNSTNAFTGYISNFRLVKGTAVYTSNFVPSALPLTAISGTSLLACQSNGFKDNSANNFTFTIGGTPRVQRLSPFNLEYSYSTAIHGGSAYFTPANTSGLNAGTTLFNAMPSAFTMEAWVYPLSYGGSASQYQNRPIMAKGVVYMNFGLNSSGNVMLYHYEGNAQRNNNSTAVAPLNAWTHIVASVSAGTITFYVNGQSSGTGTWYGMAGDNTADYIGYHTEVSGPQNYFDGYLSDVRYAKSVIYSGNFTPPTAPISAVATTAFLLSGKNAAIFDSTMMHNLETVGNTQISTSVKKYGTGSIYFDGTGDYLRAPANAKNLEFGTGDFTVECWAYQTATNTYPSILEIGNHIATSGILFITSNGTSITMYSGGFYGTAPAPALNTWNHIAWVRSNGMFRIYVNGVGNTAVAYTNDLNTANKTTIGNEQNAGGGYAYTGYIDELRVTKGYARYTANFTPPTAAFKAK